MRRATSCFRDLMASISFTSWTEPAVGARPLAALRRFACSSQRRVAAAAAPSPPPPSEQPRQQAAPPQHGGGSHQREQYEHIKRQWHVPRTRLHHLPAEVQAAIRRGDGRRAPPPPQARSLTSLPADPAGEAPGGLRGAQAALVADLDKLGAALEYEQRTGYTNVVGSLERVPVGEWAARQLLSAAGRLQDAAAAHACVAAAQQLWRYAELAPTERVTPVGAALAAVQAAALSLQLGSRLPAARQARHQPPPAQPAPQQAQQQSRAQQPLDAQQQQQQQQQQPLDRQELNGSSSRTAEPLQAPPQLPPPAASAPPPAGGADADLDAAAEEAHAEEVGHQPHTPEGEEYVMSGNRRIKASTAAFRASFAEAAAAAAEARAAGGGGVAAVAAAAEQRSAQWFHLREGRLTASAFSKAIGLFDGDRQQLWGEKVGMVEPFAGNAATAWGTSAEPRALDTYQAVTGQRITSCMFQVRRDDPVHGWLGASPDGLIESLALEPQAATAAAGAAAATDPAAVQQQQQQQQEGMPPQAWPAVAFGRGPLAGPGRGILEIKCPHNRGQPELAVPPQHATWYYMPQVQGLMYIFDCEWCNLYIWTPQRGSAVYHIRRDRAYWGRLWGVLADFWWSHVVPARQEFQAGRWEEVEQYRPPPTIPDTEELRQWSKRMALAAPATFFKPQAGL